MIIKGIQKTSMVDYPGLLCVTLFTPGCNLRCPFCHNSPLVLGGDADSQIEEEELLEFLKERKGRLDGVCITGGEPLLQKNALPFLEKLKILGYKVKLDTNGCFPEHLKKLYDSGVLDYIAMDVKNSPARYGETVGSTPFDLTPVKKSIALLKTGRVPYEFRTTVSKTFHDAQSLKETGELIEGADFWYLQAFKNSGNLIDESIVGYDENSLHNLCNMLQGYAKHVILRGV